MADSFTSTVDGTTANFNVLYELGGGSRSVKADAAISVRLLPYGPPPNAVIQSAGGMPEVRTHKLDVLSQSDYADLRHCRGHHGTLSITEGTFDCTLQSVSSGEIETDLQRQSVVASWVMDDV